MTRPQAHGYDTCETGVIDGMSGTRQRVTTAVTTGLVTAALVLSGCASTTAGTAISDTTSPTTSTSRIATTTTTAPRPVDPYADLREVTNAAMLDVSGFWALEGGVVVPVDADVVTDRDDADCIAPGQTTAEEAAAIGWACDMVSPPSVAFDAANLNDEIYVPFSDVGVYLAAAHEAAHIGMPMIRTSTDTDDDVEERRADCAAGAYFAWVAAPGSPSSTSVTEADVSGTVIKMWGKDSPRTAAVAAGFSEGLQACLSYTPRG